MSYLLAALAYVADGSHWSGALGIGTLLAQHVGYSLLGVALAAVIGVPLGWLVGHTGHGRDAAAALSPSVRRAVLKTGVDPSSVKGSGKDGRVMKEDVARAGTQAPAPASLSQDLCIPACSRCRCPASWLGFWSRRLLIGCDGLLLPLAL